MVEKITIFSNFGETATMDAVDANRALLQHPQQWSREPFSAAEIAKGKKALGSAEKIGAHIRADEQGKAPDPEPLTADERAELVRLRKEASERQQPVTVDYDAMRSELLKKNNPDLFVIAAAENIAVETDDDKRALVTKIIAGRTAAATQS